jgi:hypothetical protein
LVIAQRDLAVVREAAKIRTNSFASASKFSKLALLTMLAIDEQLQPKRRFIGLFYGYPDFRDEVSPPPGPAGTPVIGCYGSS